MIASVPGSSTVDAEAEHHQPGEVPRSRCGVGNVPSRTRPNADQTTAGGITHSPTRLAISGLNLALLGSFNIGNCVLIYYTDRCSL